VPLGYQHDVSSTEGATLCTADRYSLSMFDLPPVAGAAGTIEVSGIAGAGTNGLTDPLVCRRGYFANITDRFTYFCALPRFIAPGANFLDYDAPVVLRGINEDSSGFLTVAVGPFETPPVGDDTRGVTKVASPLSATLPTTLPGIRDPPTALTIPVSCDGAECPGKVHVYITSTDSADDANDPDSFGEIDCVQTGGRSVEIPADAMGTVTGTAWRKITIRAWHSQDKVTEDDRHTQVVFSPGLGVYAEIVR
jgi:hypothetical protein